MLTAEKKKYTYKDYMLLEEGAPFQLIDYDLIMSPSPSPVHQRISLRLSAIVIKFIEQNGNIGGEWFFAPLDVKFDNGNVFQPDAFFISEERKSDVIKERIEGAPDLVIEILSPSNAYYDLRQKKDIYEKYGVKEFLVFDPIQQNAEIYFLENGVYVLKQKADKSQTLNSVLLQGLSFDLSKIY